MKAPGCQDLLKSSASQEIPAVKDHSVLLQDSEEALPSQGREAPVGAAAPTCAQKDQQPRAWVEGMRPSQQTLPRATLHAQGLGEPASWGWGSSR